MAYEKQFTAKQVAEEVLKKAIEVLEKSEVLSKYEPENHKSLGYKLPEAGKKEKENEPKYNKEYDTEKGKGPEKHRIEEQTDPNKNMKEKAEGNNQTPGAYPQNTKKYLMERSEKYGQIRKHLIDQVHSVMQGRLVKAEFVTPNTIYGHASALGIFDLTKGELCYGADTYVGKAEESLAKDFGTNFAQAATSGSITPAKIQEGARSIGATKPAPSPAPMKKDGAIQAGIAAAGGGGNAPINSGVASSLGGAFGKSEKNPDEKQDARLGEDVEHLCEDHFKDNKEAERKEGHKLVAKSECKKCEMEKCMHKNENIVSPSKESGQGTTLDRSKAQKDWMEKCSKSEQPAAKTIGVSKLHKFLEDRGAKLSKSEGKK